MPQSYSPVYFPQDWSPISMSAANQFEDSCTDDADNNIGNYATLNPIYMVSGFVSADLSNGNLTANSTNTGSGNARHAVATIPIPSSGKWAAKMTYNSGTWLAFGVGQHGTYPGTPSGPFQDSTFDGLYQDGSDIEIYDSGSSVSSSHTKLSAGGYAEILVDVDANTIKVYTNGSQIGSTITNISADNPAFVIFLEWANVTLDFGQNGYTPTDTSYKTLNTANLPAPTVTDSSEFFKTVEFSGTGSAQNIDTVGFRPDLLIIKSRTSTANFNWVDSVRGASEILWSNAEVAQSEETTSVTGFRDAGFSVGSDSGSYVNISGQTMMAFCLKAGGSTTSSNTDGTITSEVTAASHGGFSIAKYTGTGANATFGHGCSRAPKFILIRAYEQGYSWTAWHEGLTSGDYVIFLSGNAAESDQSGGAWQSTPPSSSVVTLGSQTGQNGSGQVHVCYSFARTPGLIGIGNYTGTGTADGPMIVVEDGGSGFKPAWLMVRRTNPGDDWKVSNSVMSPFNPVLTNSNLNINTSAAADTPSGPIDYLANGFKPRLANGPWNASGDNYIYLAFAENPFGGSDVAQARAR